MGFCVLCFWGSLHFYFVYFLEPMSFCLHRILERKVERKSILRPRELQLQLL